MIYRNLFKKEKIYAFNSVLIPSIIQLLYLLFVIKIIPNDIFGSYITVQAYTSLTTIVLSQLANEAFTRFINIEQYKNFVLNDLLIFSLSINLTLSLVTLYLLYYITDFEYSYLIISTVIGSISMVNGLLISSLLMNENRTGYLITRVAEALGRTLLPILLYIIDKSVAGLLVGSLLGALLSVSTAIRISGYKMYIRELNLKRLFKYINFSYHTIPICCAVWMTTWLDKIFIEHYHGEKILGSYAKVLNVANMIQIVGQIYTVLVNPNLFRKYEISCRESYDYLKQTIIKLLFVLSVLIAFAVIATSLGFTNLIMEISGINKSFQSIFLILCFASCAAIVQNSLSIISSLERRLEVNTLVYVTGGILASIINMSFLVDDLIFAAVALLSSHLMMILLFTVIWRRRLFA